MVSVILLLQHYVIRPNGLQMCVIVFSVGLSMFLRINPVGAKDMSAHHKSVCVLRVINLKLGNLLIVLHIVYHPVT